MKKFDIVREAKFINVAAGLVFAAGLLLLIFEQMGSPWERLMIGIMCVIIGGAKLLGYFANDLYRLAFQFDLAVGILAVLFGVLIFIGPDTVAGSLPVALGIYVMLDALLKLQTAFDARRFGITKWLLIFLTAIALLAAGILTVVSPYVSLPDLVMLGVALMADGIENIWITAYTVRVRTRKKRLSEKYGTEDEA